MLENYQSEQVGAKPSFGAHLPEALGGAEGALPRVIANCSEFIDLYLELSITRYK